MILRTIAGNEYSEVFQMGYKEWKKGRTYDQYIQDNQKEDAYGERYVYVNEDDNIIGSFIVLSLEIKLSNQTLKVFGIGSIVIHNNYQNKGFGTKMLKEFFSSYPIEDDSSVFLLYSDINPQFYYPFSFKELPLQLQHSLNSTSMIRCSQKFYNKIEQVNKLDIPSYF
ncbi:GNAT family N-acetyltransferase [Niallia sp. 03133]|uniref:GNAT family N-acetyltransferase n=1 Tax=Niallia sp. 03133 TaxID=3458060 RepID=UPI004043FBE4